MPQWWFNNSNLITDYALVSSLQRLNSLQITVLWLEIKQEEIKLDPPTAFNSLPRAIAGHYVWCVTTLPSVCVLWVKDPWVIMCAILSLLQDNTFVICHLWLSDSAGGESHDHHVIRSSLTVFAVCSSQNEHLLMIISAKLHAKYWFPCVLWSRGYSILGKM